MPQEHPRFGLSIDDALLLSTSLNPGNYDWTVLLALNLFQYKGPFIGSGSEENRVSAPGSVEDFIDCQSLHGGADLPNGGPGISHPESCQSSYSQHNELPLLSNQ